MGHEIEGSLREFIADNFFVSADRENLPDTQSLLDAGIIDSTGVLELLAFIEEKFAITVADSEIIPENLDSVRSIVAYLEAKRTAVA